MLHSERYICCAFITSTAASPIHADAYSESRTFHVQTYIYPAADTAGGTGLCGAADDAGLWSVHADVITMVSSSAAAAAETAVDVSYAADGTDANGKYKSDRRFSA